MREVFIFLRHVVALCVMLIKSGKVLSEEFILSLTEISVAMKGEPAPSVLLLKPLYSQKFGEYLNAIA